MPTRSAAQTSGDLPAAIDIDPVRTGRTDHDEGTAMLEIVHDLAPGASLAFSGPSTSLEMVESIRWLTYDAFDGAGSDIIVDDLGYYFEPYYSDGMVAQVAQKATEDGVIFASSAGNSAEDHYAGAFSGSSRRLPQLRRR